MEMLIRTRCSVALASAILFDVQAHAGKSEINDTNKLVDKMQDCMDELVNDMGGKLFDRILETASPLHTDLDETMLRKPGQSAIPAVTRSFPLLPIARPSLSRTSVGLGICNGEPAQCATKLGVFDVFKGSERGMKGIASRNVRTSAGEEKRNGVSDLLNGLEKLLAGSEDNAPDKPEATQEMDKVSNDREKLQKDRDMVLRLNKEKKARKTISGRRIIRQREGKELDEFFDFGTRFESAKTLLRAMWLGGFGNMDEVGPGQLVVMMEDIPSQRLVKGQLYEVVRIYYQLRGSITKKDLIEVAKVGAPNPAVKSKGEVWDKWCELYSEEYHSQPVRCQMADIKLRPVGNEVSEALSIALPVAVIPIGTFALYGALTSGGQWCLLGPFLGHC